MNHFHDLEGGGIAEDKRMINSKSPWTLAHLEMKVLQSFYNNPAVPPSMKTKLKSAMMMKPSLKKKLKGGVVLVPDFYTSPVYVRMRELERLIPHLEALRAEVIASPAGEAGWKKSAQEIKLKAYKAEYEGLRYFLMGEAEQKYIGGLAGVSKASGFIQRMMAENKKKHSGEYKKPTDPAHKDSTMSKWIPFDYKKLANKDQGGEGSADYGASPFIQKYFKGDTVPFTRGNTAKETDKQKEARFTMMAKRLAKLAKRLAKEQPENKAVQEQVQEAREAVEEQRAEPEPVETPAELLEHFGNIMGEPPVGIEVTPKEKSEEEATPADPEVSILSEDVLTNRVWSPYVCFWRRFIKKYPKVEFSRYDWTQPFMSLTYTHGGFYYDFYRGSPLETSNIKGRKEMYKDFLMKWLGYKEDELYESYLVSDKSVKFWKPDVSKEESDRREEAMNDKKNLMGYSYILWLCGKLVKEKGYKISMEEADYQIYNESVSEWVTKRGERIILKSPEGATTDITSLLSKNYDGRGALLGKEYKEGEGGMDKFWKEEVYTVAEETDIDINDTIFSELEPEDGVDRDVMKLLVAYVEKETKKRKAEEEEKMGKEEKKRSGQSGSAREENIKKILEKTPRATLPAIAEELKKLGDTGAGGKPLSAGTLSPIVKKVKESIKGLEGGELRMCGV